MMQTNNKNKEQFKLLQYSDDSKSLSDLELTEIVVPRKRKVRRKTKPKNGQRQRKSSTTSNSEGSCRNIMIWLAIISNCCWLMILSYVISVIHSEYSQLDKQIGKLSAVVKSFPDSLDSLESNQTTIFTKISEIQQSIKSASEDFVQLKEFIKQQSHKDDDGGQIEMLQKKIADFGANIASFSTEVDRIKEKLTTVQQNLASNQQENEYFKKLIVEKRLNSTDKNPIPMDPKQVHELEDLRNITSNLTASFANLNSTLSTIESDLITRIQSNENETLEAKKNIGKFTDLFNNATSHIVSLENYWIGQKGKFDLMDTFATHFDDLDQKTKLLNEEFQSLNSSMLVLKSHLESLSAPTSPPASPGPEADSTAGN